MSLLEGANREGRRSSFNPEKSHHSRNPDAHDPRQQKHASEACHGIVPRGGAMIGEFRESVRGCLTTGSSRCVSKITSIEEGRVTTITAVIAPVRPKMYHPVAAQKAIKFVPGVTRPSPKAIPNCSGLSQCRW